MAHSQPHIFGAKPLHYRQGTAFASGDAPPIWSPEMSLDTSYPYTLEEYMFDVSRWMAATKVAAERQGPMIALALGGAARTLADNIPTELLASGSVADLGDGLGAVQRSGPKLLMIALGRQFPSDKESIMLRTGLEFFSFCPRQGETVQIIFLRFDTMLDKANQLCELNISFAFRTWMIMALLRLPPRKWVELLKDMQHRFPRNHEEYKSLQNTIVREKSLEYQVGALSRGGSGATGVTGTNFLTGQVQEDDWLPLHLCLGSPAGGQEAHVDPRAAQRSADATATVLLSLGGIEDSDSDFSDEDTWQREDREDPYSPSMLEAEQQKAAANPEYLHELYWTKRKATRKFRAAKGRFGPRVRFHPRKLGNKFTRRGLSARTGGPTRKGFFVGQYFVSLDHIPEEEIIAFFSGKTRNGNIHKRDGPGSKSVRCYNCGGNH